MQMRTTGKHLAHTLAQSSVIAILIAGMMAGSVFAGKGGGGGKPGGGGSTGGGTLVMVPMDGATEAHFGARVTFTISTSATYPYVHLTCYQNGTLVAEGRQGFFSTALGNKWFILGPTPLWTGGAADCTATLEKAGSRGAWTVLGSTSFHVYE
jgi:hypothetical protein